MCNFRDSIQVEPRTAGNEHLTVWVGSRAAFQRKDNKKLKKKEVRVWTLEWKWGTRKVQCSRRRALVSTCDSSETATTSSRRRTNRWAWTAVQSWKSEKQCRFSYLDSFYRRPSSLGNSGVPVADGPRFLWYARATKMRATAPGHTLSLAVSIHFSRRLSSGFLCASRAAHF